MRRVAAIAGFAVAVLLCGASLAPDAEAARLGGGKSFGGRSGYSRPAEVPRQHGSPAYSRQQAANQRATPGMAPRSGFGGMLGGLLAGTLLGSLLFGGPHAGVGIMDVFLFAFVAFLALKLLRAIMARGQTAQEGYAYTEGGAPGGPGGARGKSPWQCMREAEGGGAPVPGMPAGFDSEEFLRGAKALFTRLQDSWDRRDIADIATFATKAILDEVEQQAAADPEPSTTEILLVTARLVSVERDGGEEVATVFFDVLARENPDADTPTQVRELWHFVRPAGSGALWRLDGIQQVA